MYDILFQYAYLIGALIFFIIWLPIFYFRKDLRRELIFAGIIGSLLAATDVLWVPEYWDPPFLFDLMNKIGVTIEDLTIGFFEGGVAAVLFEVVERRREYKIKKDHKYHLGALIVFLIGYFLLEFLFPATTLINWCISAVIASIVVGVYRRDLISQMLAGGLFFTLTYFLLFQFFIVVFPAYIPTFYNLENFSGVYIINLPIEEISFAFTTGMLWSILYEYTLGYRDKKIAKG
jgi:hypothetical protein